jgi:arsenate reductase-like glutaredoxin family protein
LEDSEIKIADRTPASKKLQESDSRLLLESASKLIALKGKKVNEFSLTKGVSEEAVAAMLGPTGNMRAPTIRAGKKLIVGFNEEIFQREFG